MKSRKHDSHPQVRVLLADQDASFAYRLAQVLIGPCGFRLCGHVLDRSVAPAAVAGANPDLVLVDTDRDSTGALNLIGRLAAAGPRRRFIATMRRSEPEEAERALRAGALGVLLKSEPEPEILDALRTVAGGRMYVSRAISAPLLKRLLNQPSTCARSGVDSLTGRELRIFELFGFGLSKREVANRLGLSCKTVESHRSKIQHRLGVEGAAEFTQFACAWVQRGLGAGLPGENTVRISTATLPGYEGRPGQSKE
jgi:DNA-binding NarL/FixJ family response regulator